jgi:hypothetical protein
MDSMMSDQLDLDPGFVNRPASRDRAEYEKISGVWSDRKSLIWSEIMKAGSIGKTWRDLARIFPGLHHGQISGTLSKLHQEGKIFALRIKNEDRCHPYIDGAFRHFYHVRERFDEPIKTQTSRDAVIGREVRKMFERHIHLGSDCKRDYFLGLDQIRLDLDEYRDLIALREMVEDKIDRRGLD